ncbi:hypothetical protein NFI96_002515 [Prochilodus magdalenae]|nr:hypothetical protein NFI96_002515 [Prochilodus magdalenae]
MSLALADLLYLSTAPFIVYHSLVSNWAFGELGCRLLLSLDLLTMHASIFTLTAMSLDRYRAVADPLAASSAPSSGLLRVALAWGLAVALSLPMMITLHLEDGENQEAKLCVPAWDEQSSKTYLSVLFCTSILAPGLAIGGLYTALGRLYWVSQTQPAWVGASSAYPPRAPRPKVLLLILGIVIAFWACFLPFWIWQLLPLYRPDVLRVVPVGTQWLDLNQAYFGLDYIKDHQEEVRGTIESILTSSLTVWYGSCTASDQTSLQRVVRTAERIIRTSLLSVQDLYPSQCRSRATKMVRDSTHPVHGLFRLLPSGKRYCSMRCRTARLSKSFFPQAIRLLNAV